MKKTAVGAIFVISLFRLGGGVVLVKIAVAAVIPEPDRIPSTRPAFAMSSRIDWPLAALGDDRLERVRVRGGVDQHLAADREADPADPVGSTSGRLRRYSVAACRSRSPTQPKMFGSPSLAPSPRRSKRRTP